MWGAVVVVVIVGVLGVRDGIVGAGVGQSGGY